jgi:hypothetical protein
VLKDFPVHIQQKVQRILDREARRLLAEDLERDAAKPDSEAEPGIPTDIKEPK